MEAQLTQLYLVILGFYPTLPMRKPFLSFHCVALLGPNRVPSAAPLQPAARLLCCSGDTSCRACHASAPGTQAQFNLLQNTPSLILSEKK